MISALTNSSTAKLSSTAPSIVGMFALCGLSNESRGDDLLLRKRVAGGSKDERRSRNNEGASEKEFECSSLFVDLELGESDSSELFESMRGEVARIDCSCDLEIVFAFGTGVDGSMFIGIF